MISSPLINSVITLLNVRKSKILTYAQVAMTEHQFKAFKGLMLDELGKNGFETELAQLLDAGKHSVDTRNRQE
ncbi:MAG: hypothetical protein WBP13_07600 [Methylophilaceae bacterium]